MEYAACHVVYLDKSILEDRFVGGTDQSYESLSKEPEIQANIKTLLDTFHQVYICTSGVSCLDKVKELETIATTCNPTFIFVEVALDSDDDQGSDTGSTAASQKAASKDSDRPRQDSGASGDFSGLALIKHLNADIHRHNLSKLAIPVAVVPEKKVQAMKNSMPSTSSTRAVPALTKSLLQGQSESEHMMRCVQAGAADIILGPMSSTRVAALSVHAHRARLEGIKEQPTFLEQKRMRKRSWVGVDEERPYAYLRESMVSTLMESICKPHSAITAVSSASPYTIKPEREQVLLKAITRWHFSAHSFTDDELLHAAFLMLQHALTMDELDRWRIPADELRKFLLASRSAYNSFVLYHNFRHVIDVLQAVFFFLLQIGTLPPHPSAENAVYGTKDQSAIAALLGPFDAFVLLISAIGHDVGHPGVNNAFLVALKAPLAQLYNDNSVLEAFHCAAYSQILRRYWNSAFEDTNVRKLLIKSILATDMQMHFKYMADMGNLQEKLAHNGGTDGWSVQQLEEYKVLTCGLLIKCADISNVARPFEVATKWADVLQQEFSRQGEMERNVGIPTTLFGGPPELGNIEKLGQSQIGFMNVFAYPLFESVADLLPGMKFGIAEIKANQTIWKQKIEVEKARSSAEADSDRSEGIQSPRSGSPDRVFAARSPETSHPEGLPATSSSPMAPPTLPMSTSQGTPDLGTPIDSNTPRNSPPIASNTMKSAKSAPDVSNTVYRNPSFGLPTIPTDPMGGNDASTTSSGIFNGIDAANKQSYTANRSIPSSLQLDSSTTSNSALVSSQENTPPSQVATPSYPAQTQSGGVGFVNQRSEPGTPASPPTPANFSRPISMRHSAHHSVARSSAPSNAPTFASTALPTSPTETQATSVLTHGSDINPDSVELDRPSSGYSSAFAASTASSNKSPGQASTIKTPPSGNGFNAPHMPGANGHVDAPNKLRKKSSRFKFDFWKKRRAEGINS